jgi:acetyltransferase
VRQADDEEAELGVVVADRYQEMGLVTELLRRLIEIAKREGIRRIKAEILSENAAMVKLAKHFHFNCVRGEDLASLTATLNLESPRTAI